MDSLREFADLPDRSHSAHREGRPRRFVGEVRPQTRVDPVAFTDIFFQFDQPAGAFLGVVIRFGRGGIAWVRLGREAADLAEAVPYAVEHKDEKPASGAIYGGIEGGMTDEADDFIRAVMTDMLDKHQSLPREPVA